MRSNQPSPPGDARFVEEQAQLAAAGESPRTRGFDDFALDPRAVFLPPVLAGAGGRRA